MNRIFETTGSARTMLEWIRNACTALSLACLTATAAFASESAPESAPPAARVQQEMSVDALSVVKVRSKAVANARTSRSLGTQREGTGVVIDSEGLVLTIGYLIIEAETVE
ncbi:MAG: hypothetical protein ACREUP_14770, partial [Burkholderiales bacterium]